jgi:hypothetical protein
MTNKPIASIKKARAKYERNFIKITARVSPVYHSQLLSLVAQHGSQSKAVEYMLEHFTNEQVTDNNNDSEATQKQEEVVSFLKAKLAALEEQIEAIKRYDERQKEREEAIDLLFEQGIENLNRAETARTVDELFDGYLNRQ